MARPLKRLFDVAEGQWGLCTRQQAQQAGVGASSLARLTHDGLLERVAHGVYRVRGGASQTILSYGLRGLRSSPVCRHGLGHARPTWRLCRTRRQRLCTASVICALTCTSSRFQRDARLVGLMCAYTAVMCLTGSEYC